MMSTTRVAAAGPFVFGLAVAALGLQQIASLDLVPGPLVAPAWVPWRTGVACLSGAVLLAAGATIGLATLRRRAALSLAVVFALVFLAFQLPAPLSIVRDGVARTRTLETLAFLATALALAGAPLARAGRVLFALCLAVLGAQHFMYAGFIASLVPAWIPGGGLFWNYATGVGLIAAGVAIGANRLTAPAGLLLALMLGAFVVTLHAPRTLSSGGNSGELNSLLVALAMTGAALVFAAPSPPRAVTGS
ncbi:MAG: hypothetical protein ABW221_22510 [Vicinamibacteria bacterium]